MEINSPNFAFLADLDPPLMHQAALAERYCLDDPCTALTKLRLFGELLAKNIAARYGAYTKAEVGKRKKAEAEAAAYLGFDKVSDAFAQKMKTVFRLAIRQGQLYRNGKYVGKV